MGYFPATMSKRLTEEGFVRHHPYTLLNLTTDEHSPPFTSALQRYLWLSILFVSSYQFLYVSHGLDVLIFV